MGIWGQENVQPRNKINSSLSFRNTPFLSTFFLFFSFLSNTNELCFSNNILVPPSMLWNSRVRVGERRESLTPGDLWEELEFWERERQLHSGIAPQHKGHEAGL